MLKRPTALSIPHGVGGSASCSSRCNCFVSASAHFPDNPADVATAIAVAAAADDRVARTATAKAAEAAALEALQLGPDEGKREAARRRPAACIALTHGPAAASKYSRLEDAGVVPTHHDDLPQGEEATRSLEALLAFTQGTGRLQVVQI